MSALLLFITFVSVAIAIVASVIAWRIARESARHSDARVATLGRDHYVRVMYAGYLWPFGHAASLIKVTERKFEEANGIVFHQDAQVLGFLDER